VRYHRSRMNLDALFVSKDGGLLGVLRQTLEKMSVTVDACPGIEGGSEHLKKRKYDAVIIDCDDMQGGAQLLQDLRKTQSNSKSVAFAVLNGKTSTQQAFQWGANFVLQKPVTTVHARRCFHAALNFMVRERRRYFRCPVEMPVHVGIANGSKFNGTSTNLSEGGLAIRVGTKLAKDSTVEVRFTLPDSHVSLEVNGEVAWTDGSGQAGIRFIQVPQTAQYELDKWLSERLKQEMPRELTGYPALV